jgi:hypothetical protein
MVVRESPPGKSEDRPPDTVARFRMKLGRKKKKKRTVLIRSRTQGSTIGLSFSICVRMRVRNTKMVPPARFQRATFRLGGGRSMQLSYGSTTIGIVPRQLLVDTSSMLVVRC